MIRWKVYGPLASARFYKNKQTARAACDRLDLKYGAYAHDVRMAIVTS